MKSKSASKSTAGSGSAAALGSAIRERYTVKQQKGKRFCVYLVVDHQSFLVAKDCRKPDAEWFRTQLAAALERMISQNAEPCDRHE